MGKAVIGGMGTKAGASGTGIPHTAVMASLKHHTIKTNVTARGYIKVRITHFERYVKFADEIPDTE